jgi:geranylgeranyl diphosphate synthase type I
VYGDEATIRKPILSDMHEGKQTVLIHYALAAATPAQARQLRKIWGHHKSAAGELATVRELLNATGAHDKVKALAESQLSDGLAALEATRLSKSAKAELTKLAHFCVDRQY